MYCWIDGEILRTEDIRISPFDHGFLYGVGFFETFRTYDGRLFLFDEHMDRLQRALSEHNIATTFTIREIRDAVSELNQLAEEKDGYFRLNVSAGVHRIGLAPAKYETPTVILFRKELPVTPTSAKKAVWLTTSRNSPETTVRHKSHNFLNNVRGRLEVSSLSEVEGLFLTEDGFVAEGVTSNVFWVKNGELFTPSIETGILPGTTRACLIELARRKDIVVNEGWYKKEEVENADEVFVTNAIQEIVPLVSLEKRTYLGIEGPVYKNLHTLYKKMIGKLKEGKE